jgi:hypothetical protein
VKKLLDILIDNVYYIIINEIKEIETMINSDDGQCQGVMVMRLNYYYPPESAAELADSPLTGCGCLSKVK